MWVIHWKDLEPMGPRGIPGGDVTRCPLGDRLTAQNVGSLSISFTPGDQSGTLAGKPSGVMN